MAYSTTNQAKLKRGPKSRPLEERFWAKVTPGTEDECWPWQGGTRNETDYGSLADENGNQINVHRISFTLHFGDPGEFWVLHTCDMKHCVNPKHLYIGDRYEWAQKWHGVDLGEDDIAERHQRAQQRSRQYYIENRAEKRQYIQKYQQDRKRKAVALLGGKCFECSQTHPAALQFHHRDPSTKQFNVNTKTLSTPKKIPWEVVIKEIQKCDLLCASCHAIYHSAWNEAL